MKNIIKKILFVILIIIWILFLLASYGCNTTLSLSKEEIKKEIQPTLDKYEDEYQKYLSELDSLSDNSIMRYLLLELEHNELQDSVKSLLVNINNFDYNNDTVFIVKNFHTIDTLYIDSVINQLDTTYLDIDSRDKSDQPSPIIPIILFISLFVIMSIIEFSKKR